MARIFFLELIDKAERIEAKDRKRLGDCQATLRGMVYCLSGKDFAHY